MAITSTAFAKRFGLQEDDTPYLETLGLHLQTVQNEIAMDAESTLRAISEVGFKQIELTSTMDADETVKIARDLGLNVNSAFFNWKTIAAADEPDVPTMEAVVEKAAELELKYLVFGYIGKGYRESVEKFKNYADVASDAGNLCRAAGIQLCYHNHSFEFKPLEEGVTGMEIFIERFHQDLVKFELDVFGLKIGGQNVTRMLRQLEGRVAQVHLSDIKPKTAKQFDESKIPAETFAEFGEGAMPLNKILATCEETGVEQCYIEHVHAANPLKSVANSFEQFNQLKAQAEAEKKKKKKDKEENGNNNPFGHHDHDHDHEHVNDDSFEDIENMQVKLDGKPLDGDFNIEFKLGR